MRNRASVMDFTSQIRPNKLCGLIAIFLEGRLCSSFLKTIQCIAVLYRRLPSVIRVLCIRMRVGKAIMNLKPCNDTSVLIDARLVQCKK